MSRHSGHPFDHPTHSKHSRVSLGSLGHASKPRRCGHAEAFDTLDVLSPSPRGDAGSVEAVDVQDPLGILERRNVGDTLDSLERHLGAQATVKAPTTHHAAQRLETLPNPPSS